MSTMPALVATLRLHGSATLAQLADELHESLSTVAANLGGLHDYGYVTRYGSNPDSLASWDGPDDGYVLQMLAEFDASSEAGPTPAGVFE